MLRLASVTQRRKDLMIDPAISKSETPASRITDYGLRLLNQPFPYPLSEKPPKGFRRGVDIPFNWRIVPAAWNPEKVQRPALRQCHSVRPISSGASGRRGVPRLALARRVNGPSLMSRVLIIEDDPLIAKIYRCRLEEEGFEVEVVDDGQMGLARFQASPPHALLLDVMLPHIDGFQILRAIRSQARFSRIPIFVVTNVFLPEVIREATQAGATEIFHKARLTVNQIVDKLRGALAATLVIPETSAPPPANAAAAAAARLPTNAPPPAPTLTPEPASPNSSASQTPAALELAVNTAGDAEFQSQLRCDFLTGAPGEVASLRQRFQEFLDRKTEADRLASLSDLYRKARSIASNATVAGLNEIGLLGSALQALLKALHERPAKINHSSAGTAAQAVELLASLLEQAPSQPRSKAGSNTVLVVDDEAISAKAISYALEKVQLTCRCLTDPVAASVVVAQQPFDLIILDQEMPGLAGFNLCAKLSSLPLNQHTPVLVITPLADFDNHDTGRAGDNEFRIAKPYLFIELTVKALTLLLKSRLVRPEAQPRPALAAESVQPAALPG